MQSKYCQDLCEWLGPKLDPKKRQLPSPSVVFLGVLEDGTGQEEDAITLRTTPSRRDALIEAIEVALRTDTLKQSDMASLHGKLIQTAATCPARLGKGQLQALTGEQSPSPLGTHRENCLRVQLALLRWGADRVVHLTLGVVREAVLFTDAGWRLGHDKGCSGPGCAIS